MKKHILALLMFTYSIFSVEVTTKEAETGSISVDSLHRMVKILEAALKEKNSKNIGDTLRIELIEKDSSADDFFSIEWEDSTDESTEKSIPVETRRGSSRRVPDLLFTKQTMSRTSQKHSPKFGLGYKFSLLQTPKTSAMVSFQWSLDFLAKEKNDIQLYFAYSFGDSDSSYYVNNMGWVYEDEYNEYMEWRLSYLRLIGKGVKKIGLGAEAGAGVGFDSDETVAVLGPKVSFQLRWKRFVFAIEDGIHVIPNFDHKVGARVSFMLF